MRHGPVIYVDIGETLVTSFGTKRMPVAAMVALVQGLTDRGADLYCWSSKGADHARDAAEEVGLGHAFKEFLPKPQLLLDDVEVSQWKLLELQPSECTALSPEEVLAKLGGR